MLDGKNMLKIGELRMHVLKNNRAKTLALSWLWKMAKTNSEFKLSAIYHNVTSDNRRLPIF